MADIDPLLAPATRIAGPHQSTVAAILRAVEQGLFTADQANTMIDRIRAHRTARRIRITATTTGHNGAPAEEKTP